MSHREGYSEDIVVSMLGRTVFAGGEAEAVRGQDVMTQDNPMWLLLQVQLRVPASVRIEPTAGAISQFQSGADHQIVHHSIYGQQQEDISSLHADKGRMGDVPINTNNLLNEVVRD